MARDWTDMCAPEGFPEDIRPTLSAHFRAYQPNFRQRIRVRRIRRGETEIRVSLQIDRVRGNLTGRGLITGRCTMCKALLHEWSLAIGDHQIIGYDFPPFFNQYMVATTSHTDRVTIADLEVAHRLCNQLGYTAYFAGHDSGASCPEHLHFHLVEYSPTVTATLWVGVNTSVVSLLGGKATALRSVMDEATFPESAAWLVELANSMPGNIIFTGKDCFFIPRSSPHSSSWPVRLGAIEMGGLFCAREPIHLFDAIFRSDMFHDRFLTAVAAVCEPPSTVIRMAAALDTGSPTPR